MRLLEDKVALITGSGRGIGAAAARLFALHGAKVVVTDIDAEPAEETAHQIIQSGGNALSVRADVTDAGGVEELGLVGRGDEPPHAGVRLGDAPEPGGAADLLVGKPGGHGGRDRLGRRGAVERERDRTPARRD